MIYRSMMGLGTFVSLKAFPASSKTDHDLRQLKSKTAGALSVDSVGLAKDLASNWAQKLTAEVRIANLEKELATV